MQVYVKRKIYIRQCKCKEIFSKLEFRMDPKRRTVLFNYDETDLILSQKTEADPKKYTESKDLFSFM